MINFVIAKSKYKYNKFLQNATTILIFLWKRKDLIVL